MVTRGFQRPQEFKQRKINGLLVITTTESNVADVEDVIRSHIGRSDDVRSVEKFDCLNYLRSEGKFARAKSALHSGRFAKALVLG